MSNLDNFKIAEALNYLDPEYITEYESLSAYVANKRMMRRRRARIITRVAACVAIVSTGVFLTVKDVNNGLIGNQKDEIEFNNNKYTVINGNQSEQITKGDTNVPGSSSAAGADMDIFEQMSTNAPAGEIEVSVFDFDAESLTLKYIFNENNKSKWYTGPGITITDLDTGDFFYNNYGTATEYRISSDENETEIFVYRWGDSVGPLPSGHYTITSLLSDGYITYEVNTNVIIGE